LAVGINQIEARLWQAADELRANSNLTATQYRDPVLGLLFLRHAEHRFTEAAKALEGSASGRRKVGPTDYKAQGALYLPEQARFSYLVQLPERSDLGKAITDAMKAIEDDNEDLRGVLPRTYSSLANPTLVELLRLFNSIPGTIEGDAFGKIYEYFISNFAMKEGRDGGEFFTPTPIVRLIVEIIEPFHGRILDPACGSGGMFVQSARFVARHQGHPSSEISLFGQDSKTDNVRIGKMNLAVHGLSGEIIEGNTYYEDHHKSLGRFDFVMANPPFNVNRVDKERLRDDPRFPYGLPTADNANYLWIQVFASALNQTGRAGFVMANSASDARGSEGEIRRKMIQDGIVDVVVAAGPNLFYSVTLPVTLWFLDKRKPATDRARKILFVDARKVYRQIDRSHREFTPAQIELLANIVRLHRGEDTEVAEGSGEMMTERFPDGQYADVAGLCRVATLEEVEAQGWSLNPGRFVGVSDDGKEDFDFRERLESLNEEFGVLSAEARRLEGRLSEGLSHILKQD
jgi:type I restriction enzyme M protein